MEDSRTTGDPDSLRDQILWQLRRALSEAEDSVSGLSSQLGYEYPECRECIGKLEVALCTDILHRLKQEYFKISNMLQTNLAVGSPAPASPDEPQVSRQSVGERFVATYDSRLRYPLPQRQRISSDSVNIPERRWVSSYD
jgi:hypothetical protein